VLWCLRARDLFAPALQAAGLHPDRVIFAEAGDEASVLAAMEEGLRHAGLAAVIGEARQLPLVAGRRLQLAAEASGVTALVLLRRAGDAPVQPSAGVSRWRVTPLPSTWLSVPSLGRPRWRVELERCRGAGAAAWNVEACDETGHLGLPADLADRPAAAEHRRVAA
jgi:protein ImuA